MNKNILDTIFVISAIAILIGIITHFSMWPYAPYLFSTGAAALVSMRLSSPYKGPNMRLSRLYRMEFFSTLALVATGIFMFMERSEWFMLLIVAAVLQLYTAIMIPIVSKKES